MKVIIDRFEGNFAICEKEDKTLVDIEKDKLPEGVREGDVLISEGNLFFIDEDETQKRKKRIQLMMEGLWK